MPSTIQHKYSDTPSSAPDTNDITVAAEFAVNVEDGQLFTRDTNDNIRKLTGMTDVNGNVTFEHNVTIDGTITVSGDTTLSDTTIDGPTTITDTLTVNGLTVNGTSQSAYRPYRYWRLVNATASANSVDLDEIDLFEVQDGDEVAVQSEATLTSTTHDAGNPPSPHLHDNVVNPATAEVSWHDTTVENPAFYIQWDFGTQPRTIVALRQYMAAGATPGYFATFEIEVSDDAVTWDRTLYVSHQYESDTGILPDVTANTWSDYYWLETVDCLAIAETAAAGNGTGRIVYEVPGDYSTVALAVTAAQTSGAETVVISAPNQTWTLAANLNWDQPEYPNLVFIGSSATPLNIDGAGYTIDVYYTHSIIVEKADLDDIRFLMYGASQLIIGDEHSLNYDASATNYKLPVINLYEQATAYFPYGTLGDGIGGLDMYGNSRLFSGDNITFDHEHYGAGSSVIYMQDTAYFESAGIVYLTDQNSTTLTGDSIDINNSAKFIAADPAEAINRSTASAGYAINISGHAEAYCPGDITISGGSKSNLTATSASATLYV